MKVHPFTLIRVFDYLGLEGNVLNIKIYANAFHYQLILI